MVRLGVSKKKKSPRATEISQLKKEVQRLTEQVESYKRELAEATERETVTGEILRVIASSPTDIQPVLDVVAENAARLCEGTDAVIFRIEGEALQCVANYGPMPVVAMRRPIIRGSPAGRAVVDRQTIHVYDIAAEVETEFPEYKHIQQRTSTRTVLATPLLREGIPIGVIFIRRTEVRPFTGKQIALLKTFTDQAVIAIENVRLFKELEERNAELREALEHQTATSEVLPIISRSPTDVQPVLDAIVESAARVCGIDDVVLLLRERDVMVVRAHFGLIPMTRVEISIDAPEYRWFREHMRAILTRRTVHIHDLLEAMKTDFPGMTNISGTRTILCTPLLREGVTIGVILLRRQQVHPFSDRQIKLLETFASQAVIAIENVRLFKELEDRNRQLTEALEQQTATSEILRVIASSPTDLQPVLDVVAESAARLCEANDALLFRVHGDVSGRVASYGTIPAPEAEEDVPLIRSILTGRAILDRQTFHVHDLAEAAATEFPDSMVYAKRFGVRTIVATPLVREGVSIGAIVVRRTEVRAFSEKQIALLKTFADQAVIAIENVRLFQELQSRNAELREALEHQTATAEVLGIISRSPTDVHPVLNAIVESAAKVCGIDDVTLRLREGNELVARAHIGPVPIFTGREAVGVDELHLRWVCEHGTLHIPDIRTRENDFPTLRSYSRTFLSIPLRQRGELIGTLTARRLEVRPFTPAQIKLLETFADQAVIAIENVRLFQELKESLEQQTATSEILGVIARSPTDLQPVLNVVAENAARLCEATDAMILRVDGDNLRTAAKFGPIAAADSRKITRGFPGGRAVIDQQTVHVDDMTAEMIQTEFPDARGLQQLSMGRSVLAMPLLREGVAIGSIVIRSTEVRRFSDKQIALLKTFADQAVIAIENVRLFQELQARTQELGRSVGELRALGEVGQAVSSTLDLETVLTRIVSHAVQLSGTDGGAIYEYDEQSEEFLLSGH